MIHSSVGLLQQSTVAGSRTDEYRIQNGYVFSIYFVSCHFQEENFNSNAYNAILLNSISFQDGKSKQTNMPYFESGWVDEADLEKEKQRKAKGGGFKFW